MSLVIHCPNCSRRYQVADSFGGKRVRCQQCGTTFTAAVASSTPAPTAANDVFVADALTGADLSQFSALPASSPSPHVRPVKATVSNPSGGPNDVQMRLVCCGMVALAFLVVLGSVAMEAAQGIVYLGVVAFVPLMLVLGVTGLISPNVVRAVGKYGGHLPGHYKAIGWGVIGLSFVLMVAMGVGLFLVGFEPDRPGARNRPGLSRSETATVLERIRTSYETSPNMGLVRNVSFPVFSINQPNPEAAAEQALATAPGYVSGTFRISADRKKVSFQYKGEKEIANQYALLLPGPTGIYLAFTPEFEE
jgi:predicted Zn finger-like uncharacterized protein